MTDAPRPEPFFIAEHPALDFLNTRAQPRTVLYDWLDTGADLLDWMEAAGLATAAEVAPLRAPQNADALAAARAEIVAFRERFREFIEVTAGTPPKDAGHPIIAEINALLARRPRHLWIEAGEDRLALRDHQPLDAPGDLILRIAEAAAQLVTRANFHHVRQCQGPTCTLFFLDVSKNHKRRWCSMEVCGNRAKAAAFRNR
ncbi:CGNR zinc finger domain-containing protein [Tropicibacter naphthalenivorans]|nr:ABATE domain-containing protein [Tropicibacter naphthalenivorans]